MLISVPKKLKIMNFERMTPNSVSKLLPMVIQFWSGNAGLGIGCTDEDYKM